MGDLEAMGRVQSSDPDVIAYRSGGGCLMVLSLPFVAVGLFVMCSAFLPESERFKEADSGKPMSAAMALLFGGVFATVGTVLMLGRGGKTVDRRAGTVTTWWGLLVPFRSKEWALTDFDMVRIAREVRHAKNASYTVYPVRITGPGDAKMTFEETRDRAKARALGEEVAKFLELKIADASMGSEVVREPGELDESLRDKAQRTGGRPEVGTPPPGMRSVQSVVGDTLAFEIPATGLRAGHMFTMAIGLLIPAFVYFVFIRQILGEENMPGAMKAVFVGVLLVIFVGLPLLSTWGGALSSARRTARVEVSPRELRVTERGLLRTSSKAIPTDELEELEVVRASDIGGQRSKAGMVGKDPVIVARSDKASLTFGAGLSRAEVDWMRAVVWNVVTA